MSVVSAGLAAERFSGALRVAAVTAAWATVAGVTAAVCHPASGTELVVPVVVAVSSAVVMLVGRLVGTALVVLHVGLLAMFTWGEVGGLVLLSSTLAALAMLPLPIVSTGSTSGED
ncbi:hypothetical protein [Streptosporangium lutulentum]|uniref:Histidine kinase n=1 Tax=Streptosporangium lutulentum TaxID=1461250 RepID=A0ABT9Q9Y6_9ACTN|nr:hypothetical protein [Streptosporangium lutulentum]MDP9843215.1 hypothetical protein [Streptosporangium lutulentum]